jgi:diguanylate cyclase (GGDEF)-like protein
MVGATRDRSWFATSFLPRMSVDEESILAPHVAGACADGEEAILAIERGRVLVVDGTEVTRERIGRALAAEGWAVVSAAGAEEALSAAAAHAPHVVLCDLHMPLPDGLEVMRRLRAVDDAAPFVILSGDRDVDAVLHAIHAGAFDFVRRSPDNEGLIGAVTRALAHARVLRENRRLGRELRAANEALELRDRARITELAEANGRLETSLLSIEHRALHDPLTDLGNRVLFRERLVRGLERSSSAASPVTVLFLDLDGFKPINDSLGHAVGDRVLVGVARRLAEAVGTSGLSARLGGDEFGVLIDGGDEEAVSVAARIAESLSAPHHVAGVEVFASASIGIAVSLRGEETADELLRNADLAMYAAKARQSGGPELFQHRMHASAIERMSLLLDLRRALDHHEFFLHYQPIVSIATGAIVGTEALVRWRHPERGVIPPVVFIPLAEETGFIVPLGRWVLREACAAANRFQAVSHGPLKMSVNVSPRQLKHGGIIDDVERALADFKLDPRALILEITESIALEEREPVLVALKAHGVKLAIDDFGTGYSSLAYLRRLHVDIVKIHKSFIDGIVGESGDAELSRAIVRFGGAMGLRTTAEGIESPDQWAELRKLGCDFGQGYHFSRPVDPEALIALLVSQGAKA